ncbi:MAG: redoxin domain-containing protein [Verrucomicrobiota bacterium]
MIVMFSGLVGQSVSAESNPVSNFGLLDHEGDFHELYYHRNDDRTRLLVLFVQGNGCPLVQKRIPQLNRLKKTYEPKGVRCWMLNANLQDERDEIAVEAEKYGIEWPILIDASQLVADDLKLQRTAEALVIEPGTWKLRFRTAWRAGTSRSSKRG